MSANSEHVKTLVRPIVTIVMVLTFSGIAVYEIAAKNDAAWGAALTAIASSVISYWFGERSHRSK